MITQDELKRLLHYDEETGVFTWKFRELEMFKRDRDFLTWNKKYAGKKAGHEVKRRNTKYIVIGINDVLWYAHRLAMIYIGHPLKVTDKIDHISGAGIDNSPINLRIVDSFGNAKNSRKFLTNTSEVTGVSFDKKRKKWLAQGDSNGKHYNLGRFNSKNEAVTVRKDFELSNNFHPNHGLNKYA